MKTNSLLGCIAGSLILGMASVAILAQNAPKKTGNGLGYGGPPATQEEQAARQTECLKANGGVCPNGGPRQQGCRPGMCGGQAQGAGYGWRHGLRDGTGPRSTNGTCPFVQQTQPQN